MEQLNIHSEEYKKIFMDTIKENCGGDEEIAKAEYDAFTEDPHDEVSDPKTDAEECMSYWTE